jgi:hypothetical protein
VKTSAVVSPPCSAPLAPWVTRALRYPWLTLRELGVWTMLAALGLRAARGEARALAWRCAACAIAVLLWLTVGDARGGGPTHHPERALVLVQWLLAPLAALGLGSLARTSRVAAALCLAVCFVLGAPRVRDWRDGVSVDAVCAGDAVRRARRQRSDAPWFVELDRQDFLWVELRSNAPERAVPDRVYRGRAPSIEAATALARGSVVAAVSSMRVSRALESAGFREFERCGGWRVLARDQLP